MNILPLSSHKQRDIYCQSKSHMLRTMSSFTSIRSCLSARLSRNTVVSQVSTTDFSSNEVIPFLTTDNSAPASPWYAHEEQQEGTCPKDQSFIPARGAVDPFDLQTLLQGRMGSSEEQVNSQPLLSNCCAKLCAGPSKKSSLSSMVSRMTLESPGAICEHASVRWSESCKGDEPSLNNAGRTALHGRKKSGAVAIRSDSGYDGSSELADSDVEETDESLDLATRCMSEPDPRTSSTIKTTVEDINLGRRSSDRKRSSGGVWQLEWFDNEKDARKRTEEIANRGQQRRSFHHLHSISPNNPHGKRGRMGSGGKSGKHEAASTIPLKQNLNLLNRLSSFATNPVQRAKRSSTPGSDSSKSPSSWASSKCDQVMRSCSTDSPQQDSHSRRSRRSSPSLLSSALASIQRRGPSRGDPHHSRSLGGNDYDKKSAAGIFWN